MYSQMGKMFDPRISLESRLVGFPIMISGPLIAIYFQIHDSNATNFLIGASFSFVPGALTSAICNYFALGRSFEAIKPFLLFLMGATVVSILTLGGTLPRATNEMRHVEDLRHLEPASIDRIEVYEEHIEVNKGTIRTRILTVTDQSAIARFAQSASDATAGWLLRGPDTHRWYLVASGSSRREYRLRFSAKYPDSVTGRFVVDSGNPNSDFGSFRSLAMRGWIELHLRDHLQ